MLLLAVVVFTALYRFNTLGGALGGFDNDHFVHFAYARQVLAGEQPLRDFNAVALKGLPPSLMFEASAAAQRWLGETLRSEALLTVGAVSAAAGVTYLAAAAVSPSLPAAAFTILTVLEAPKLYTYPTVLVLACVALLATRYARQPSLRGVVAFAVLAAVGFLFRHDYVVYVILPAAVLAGLVTRPPRRAAAHVAAGGAISLLLVAPSLLYAQQQVGLATYIRDSRQIGSRQAQHTDLEWPAFTRQDQEGRSVGLAGTLGLEQNAISWLYYLHIAVPLVTAFVLWRTREDEDPTRRRPALVSLAALGLAAMPFLLRGNVGARFGDVGPLIAVLLAGNAGLLFRRWPPESLLRRLARGLLATVVLAMTVQAVWIVGSVRQELDTSGWSDSAEKLFRQAARRWEELQMLPAAYWSEPLPGSVGVARYLNRCTAPGDRVLVMAYAPEIVPLSGRLFAAGVARVIGEEFVSERHQRQAVERWSRQSVPLVLTEPDELHAALGREFDRLEEYLRRHYEPAGSIEADGGLRLRVFARRSPGPTGTFGADRLPCFGQRGASISRLE